MKYLCARLNRLDNKILILVTVFLLGSNYLFSQNYVPMLGESNEWYTFHPYVEASETFVYYTNGDTIVNGRNYKIIGKKGYGNTFAFIREDHIGNVLIRIRFVITVICYLLKSGMIHIKN